MAVSFSVVYPTRHRPAFVREGLRILETQRHERFQVVVSDNPVDPALACEDVCRESRLADLVYTRPPRPVGMVENWKHALAFTTGDYVCFLTDKMFVLPDALSRMEAAIEDAGHPDIVSWTSDSYNPLSYRDYLGRGYYHFAPTTMQGAYRRFSPRDELDRRGRAEVARHEMTPSDYCRGKLVFGAYRRDLVERIVERSGSLFLNINPDYTSMVLGLAEARDAIELSRSCVVSVNTDISNGQLSDTNDQVARAFLDALEGGVEEIAPRLMIPGLYSSLHNWVAHDYLALRTAFDLNFEFNLPNWVAYCVEDVNRPRTWSSPAVEAAHKQILGAYLDSLRPADRAAVDVRLTARAGRADRPLYAAAPTRSARLRRSIRHALGRVRRRVTPTRWAPGGSIPSTSPYAAVTRAATR